MVAIKIEFNTPVENGEGNELCIDFRYDEAIVVAPTEERALLEASRYVAKQGGKLMGISVRDMKVLVVNE